MFSVDNFPATIVYEVPYAGSSWFYDVSSALVAHVAGALVLALIVWIYMRSRAVFKWTPWFKQEDIPVDELILLKTRMPLNSLSPSIILGRRKENGSFTQVYVDNDGVIKEVDIDVGNRFSYWSCLDAKSFDDILL